jgi:glycosyltransferase involved in cell wall biosynthesis
MNAARVQTLAPYEIIVVDDGSVDDTAAVAAALGCRVLRQANGGVCTARNAGILAAHGEWIALLDHDDLWAPHKLERQAEALALRPDVTCVATDFVRQRRDGVDRVSCLSEPHYEFHRMTTEVVDDTIVLCPRAAQEILEPGWFLFPSSVLVRRDTIIAAGLFRPAQRLCEDVDCFLRVLNRTALLIVMEPLWAWREHPSNASRNTSGIAEGWLRLGGYVRSEPGAYPAGTLARLEPRLREMRHALVAEYTARGDFRNARRVSRTALGGRLTPTDAALAVVVEFPPSLWAMLRRARGVFRALSMSS